MMFMNFWQNKKEIKIIWKTYKKFKRLRLVGRRPLWLTLFKDEKTVEDFHHLLETNYNTYNWKHKLWNDVLLTRKRISCLKI